MIARNYNPEKSSSGASSPQVRLPEIARGQKAGNATIRTFQKRAVDCGLELADELPSGSRALDCTECTEQSQSVKEEVAVISLVMSQMQRDRIEQLMRETEKSWKKDEFHTRIATVLFHVSTPGVIEDRDLFTMMSYVVARPVGKEYGFEILSKALPELVPN